MTEFGFFGPTERHFIPHGGFCISVFGILRSMDGGLLVVRPKKHPKWEEWAPNWRIYDEASMEMEFKKWRFPSTYVKMGEHPQDAIARVMKDQLEFDDYSVEYSELLNYYYPSRRYPGNMHWDYCFIYYVKSNVTPKPKPWFSEIRYVSFQVLKEGDFGSAQGALLEVLSTKPNQRML
jgi:ADP-ribose pyrophosphatase YjhB (NUDIX family)